MGFGRFTNSGGSGYGGGLSYKGVFDVNSLYVVNNIVKYGDFLYVCNKDTEAIPPPVNILSSGVITSSGIVDSTKVKDGLYNAFAVDLTFDPKKITVTYPSTHTFYSAKFYSSPDYPNLGADKITSVNVVIDGVTLATTGSYNSTDKSYTVNLLNTKGLVVDFKLNSSVSIILSEIELYELVVNLPDDNKVNWGLFSNCTDKVNTLWTQQWTEKFILFNPADAYMSPELPLSRNGKMVTIDFQVQGTPTAATNVIVKQGTVTVGTVAISAAGETSLAVDCTGAMDDLFTYTVGGAGLSACVVTCNQKWVNR
jgi:uncharacterized Zn-binding protein involved in type VI secretion